MSEIAKRPEGGELAVRPKVTQELVNAFLDVPIEQIPALWRPHVLNFWMQFQGLPNSNDSFGMLCARIRIWRDYGMKFADLDAAMRSIMHPSRSGSFRFAADVVNAVSVIVDRHMDRRRTIEERARYEAEKLDPDALHAALQQMIARQRDPVPGPAQSDSSQKAPASDAGQAKRGPTPGPPKGKPRGGK